MSFREKLGEVALKTIPFCSLMIWVIWYATGFGLYDIMLYFLSSQPLEPIVSLLMW